MSRVRVRARASSRIDFATHGIPLAKQDQLAWCYAAVASIISKYLDPGHVGWSPCEVVSWALAKKNYLDTLVGTTRGDALLDASCNCCKKDKPHNCTSANAVYKMQPVLTQMGITFRRLNGVPDFSTITTEINQNRPVLISLYKDGAPGHAEMIVGYDYEEGRTGRITIYDPAANNLPNYKHQIDIRTMTFEVPITEIFGNYPTSKHKVGSNYTNLMLPGPLAAPPVWAKF